jgi:hypothetical protein
MNALSLAAIVVGAGFVAAEPGLAQNKPTEIDAAFSRMYNFDFQGAQALLNRHIAADPQDPLSYAVRSSAYLFSELDRLSILESEFFSSDKRIADHKKLQPDPNTRTQLFQALNDAQGRAQSRLASNPNDQDALFSFCITTGVLTDYTALVEKRQIGSLSLVKRSAAYAQRLLSINPKYYDAYLTTGMTQYVIGSLPFFVRWFVKVDNINPSKEEGMKNVELVATQGHYLKPFAKILLAVANLREKKPTEAQKLMVELTRDYPENPLFKKELAQLSAKLQSGELRDGQ